MTKFIFSILLISAAAIGANAQVTPNRPDTIEVGGITVIRDNEESLPPPIKKKGFLKKLSTRTSPKGIKTQWAILDLGVSNYVDNTQYTSTAAQNYAPSAKEEWLGIKPFKSRNVNIWFVTQQISLVHHYVNFQYGFGIELNSYYYKQPIRYQSTTNATNNEPVLLLDKTPDRKYTKNKLAADYITAPIQLNFNLTPYKLYPVEFSAGISIGYLYSSRHKIITTDEGKQRTRDDFGLRPWKLSYIAELNLGIIRFYGSYAFKSMYHRGLNITPYNFGIRIKPMEILGKIQTN